ncbi:MAG: cell division protein FtsQ [Actinomycetota bacterium]|jgi:cell division protein FtsQ
MTTSTRPRIDPRLQERRIAVKRDEGRRRLRFLIVSAVVVALVGAAAGATRSPLLDIDLIEVSGAEHVAAGTVLRTAGLDRGDLMIDLDPGAAARRIERLSWVAQADVRRQWPGTVQVRVIERRAAAAVPVAGGWATVDSSGRILERAAEPPQGLGIVDVPPIRGDRVPAGLLDALEVAAAIPERMLERVPSVVVRPDGLELPLHPTGVVRLGGPDRLGEKLTALETLLDRVDGPVAVIDVRVPDAPVLTRG